MMADANLRRKVLEIERASLQLGHRPWDLWGALVRRFYIRFINSLILHQVLKKKMIYRCNAGRKLCVVMPDGRVSPCEPFIFEDHYGHLPKFNLREYGYDYQAVLADPKYRSLLAFIEGGRCEACPWSCAAITSMIYSPSNWPLLWRIPRALAS